MSQFKIYKEIIREDFHKRIGLDAINATLISYEFSYDTLRIYFKQKESNYKLDIKFQKDGIEIKVYIFNANKKVMTSLYGEFCLFSTAIDTSDDWLKNIKKHLVHFLIKEEIIVEVEKGIATCANPRVKIIDYDNNKNG